MVLGGKSFKRSMVAAIAIGVPAVLPETGAGGAGD